MQVIVNDLSFQYKFYLQQEALDKILDFIHLCHEIESGKFKKVEKLILAGKINVLLEIVPDCNLLTIILEKESRQAQWI